MAKSTSKPNLRSHRIRVSVGVSILFCTVLAAWLARKTPLPSLPQQSPQVQANPQNGATENSVLTAKIPVTTNTATRNERLSHGVHASQETWPTEAFSEKASARLKELSKLAPFRSGPMDSFVSAQFSCVSLHPKQLVTILSKPGIRIRRGAQNNSPVQTANATLADSLRQLYELVVEDARAAFKIIRVQQVKDGFKTTILAEGGGKMQNGRMQWTATWDCAWSDASTLTSVNVTEYEEVMSDSASSPWLVDATSGVLGNSKAYRQQLLYGMDYWVNKLEHRLYVNRLGHHGLAVADVNGDGLEDLYVCQPGGLPNLLYLHQEDGTAEESAALAGTDILDDTTAALFADLDNDGDQDLALLTVSGGFVLGNDGAGHFEIKATMPDCRNTFSITAADYDRDGLLDLYVGRYWPEESVRGAIPLPVPYYDAINGGSNVLLRNAGNWQFTDVTAQVGLDVDNTRYTMAAAWEDYDNDGDQDLYVANDFGRNCLYRNDEGTFTNVAANVGVEDTAAGMSVSWSDYNHDGNMDLYVGNMFSSAGGRVTYQRQYADRFDVTARTKLQRLARGNSLFSNAGTGEFVDVSVESATTMGRWAWGSVFADLNNDSWDDLVVANGHVTTEDTGDL